MGIFSTIFKALLVSQQISKAKAQREQENVYENHPNIIKRSELTEADIENLKRMEKEDEIVFTSHSIQEARYYVAAKRETYFEQVVFYNNGQIYVEGVMNFYRWRYNEFGVIEVYYPGRKHDKSDEMYIDDEMSEFEDYLEYEENLSQNEIGYYN